MKYRLWIILTILLIIFGSFVSLANARGEESLGVKNFKLSQVTQRDNQTYAFVDMWMPKFEILMNSPYGVAVSQGGDVYVTDSNNHRVLKFTSNGVYVTEWGGSGIGLGEFDKPEGIAVDKDGYVYVVDWNERVQKFTSDGVFVTQWGEPGDTAGEFNGPRGITIDLDNNVYIADTANNRIQKFTSTGGYITQWGNYGTGDGLFQFPRDVTVDQDGYVFVADSYNHRIQKFTSQGTYLTEWGDYGSIAGDFRFPSGITVAPDGSIYVVDKNNHRIQKFTSGGGFEDEWGSEGDGEGQFSYPMGIAVAPEGSVYVVDSDNNRIQKFSLAGNFLTTWGMDPGGDYETKTIYDTHGRPLYMVNAYGALLQKWIYDGAFLVETIGYPDEAHDPAIIGIGIGQDDVFYTAVRDFHDRCIQKFSTDGDYLAEWCGGRYDSQYSFWAIRALTADQHKNVYIADTHVWVPYQQQGWPMGTFIRFQIHKFDSNGNLIKSFGFTREEDPLVQLQNSPLAIGLDHEGTYIYLAVAKKHQIKKYDTTTGDLVLEWGSEGDGEGQFNKPQGIAIDQDGNVYVADTANHRIQKFNSDGQFLSEWGSKGSGEGEFVSPKGITIDKHNQVFVADTGNHRIQKFSDDGQFVTTWGSFGISEGAFSSPDGIVTDPDGFVYVMDTGNYRIQKFSEILTPEPGVHRIFLPLLLR